MTKSKIKNNTYWEIFIADKFKIRGSKFKLNNIQHKIFPSLVREKRLLIHYRRNCGVSSLLYTHAILSAINTSHKVYYLSDRAYGNHAFYLKSFVMNSKLKNNLQINYNILDESTILVDSKTSSIRNLISLKHTAAILNTLSQNSILIIDEPCRINRISNNYLNIIENIHNPKQVIFAKCPLKQTEKHDFDHHGYTYIKT